MLRQRIVAPLIVLSTLFMSACDDRSPTGPSRLPSPVASPVASPAPPPTPDLSKLVGVWNLTVRLTAVTGSGCVADTMRSRIGVPDRYSLSIIQNDKVEVTLRSASGDRACTFSPSVDSSGFTTYGRGGYYTCDHWFLNFRCGDGTLHDIYSYGENIAGRLSGTEMSGTWDASWFESWGAGVEMKAQFTGTR
jgi:hypothetical protein